MNQHILLDEWVFFPGVFICFVWLPSHQGTVSLVLAHPFRICANPPMKWLGVKWPFEASKLEVVMCELPTGVVFTENRWVVLFWWTWQKCSKSIFFWLRMSVPGKNCDQSPSPKCMKMSCHVVFSLRHANFKSLVANVLVFLLEQVIAPWQRQDCPRKLSNRKLIPKLDCKGVVKWKVRGWILHEQLSKYTRTRLVRRDWKFVKMTKPKYC